MAESNLINDINKVFIPCRTVLEMEALTSLYLEHSNYDNIKELPKTFPTSKELIDKFRVINIEPLERIISHFIDVVVRKLKPIVMYARKHHDRFRMGNVMAYAQTRVCLYFVLHRLKIKFLLIKKIMNDFKVSGYNLKSMYGYRSDEDNSLISVFYNEYFEKNLSYLKTILASKTLSSRVMKLMNLENIVTADDIFHAIAFKEFLNDDDRIRFIMREIKASLFLVKIMFAKIDVLSPFIIKMEDVDAEHIMIDQDFIPGILKSLSEQLNFVNREQYGNLVKAFDYMMEMCLQGINYAVELASGDQINLDIDSAIYDTHNLLK